MMDSEVDAVQGTVHCCALRGEKDRDIPDGAAHLSRGGVDELRHAKNTPVCDRSRRDSSGARWTVLSREFQPGLHLTKRNAV